METGHEFYSYGQRQDSPQRYRDVIGCLTPVELRQKLQILGGLQYWTTTVELVKRFRLRHVTAIDLNHRCALE